MPEEPPQPADASSEQTPTPSSQGVNAIPELIKQLPLEQRRHVLAQFAHATTTEFQGPYPPPDYLEQYNQIVPNFAERLVDENEKQAEHRRALERLVIHHQLAESSRGQWFGFILGVLGLGLGGFCVYNGHDAAGATLGGATLIGLVSVFVAGKAQMAESLKQKRPDFSQAPEPRLMEGEGKFIDTAGNAKRPLP